MTASEVDLDDRMARAALVAVGEPGDPPLAALVDQVGAIDALEALRGRRLPPRFFGGPAQRLQRVDPATVLAAGERAGFRFVVPGDREWPHRIDELDHVEGLVRRGRAPIGLWLRGAGDLGVLTRLAVAVVGSRVSTNYGDEVTFEIAAGLARAGHTIVSGAAFGIDEAAHRGALAAHAPTIALLACGVDRAYPEAHKRLLELIAETGVVVSEAGIGGAPTRIRFLARNRLIAGMCSATVVIEAALRSGALNTASWTEQLNRPVMAVPGPVSSATSAGAHVLIRDRGAQLVTNAADVLEICSPSGEGLAPVARGETRPHDQLSLVDQQVLDAVPVVRPAPSASIGIAAGVARAEVDAALDRMVAAGLVEIGLGHDGTDRPAETRIRLFRRVPGSAP